MPGKAIDLLDNRNGTAVETVSFCHDIAESLLIVSDRPIRVIMLNLDKTFYGNVFCVHPPSLLNLELCQS